MARTLAVLEIAECPHSNVLSVLIVRTVFTCLITMGCGASIGKNSEPSCHNSPRRKLFRTAVIVR